MLCVFPFAKPVSISSAFSVCPDMSNHRGDSFKNGALAAQYTNVEITTNVEKSLHSVMIDAAPDIKQMPCEKRRPSPAFTSAIDTQHANSTHKHTHTLQGNLGCIDNVGKKAKVSWRL